MKGMLTEYLISIVVPVYNVETYLEECVRSIANQTYNNLEIILVDDGSTDNSGSLCDEMTRIDKRIVVFHKNNGGLSDARNYGIDHASGKYIMFVDSDDIISENIVETLYCLMKDNIKLATCELAHFDDGSTPIFCKETSLSILTKEEALLEFLYQKKIPTSACAKMYDIDVLKDLRFVVGQRFEDNEFVFKAISSCSKIGYLDAKLYAYRHRIDSITTSSFNEKDFDIIDIGKNIVVASRSFTNMVQEAAIVYQCTNCLRIVTTISREFFNDKRYYYCREFLDSNMKTVLKNKSARRKLKIGLLLVKAGLPNSLLRMARNSRRRWN